MCCVRGRLQCVPPFSTPMFALFIFNAGLLCRLTPFDLIPPFLAPCVHTLSVRLCAVGLGGSDPKALFILKGELGLFGKDTDTCHLTGLDIDTALDGDIDHFVDSTYDTSPDHSESSRLLSPQSKSELWSCCHIYDFKMRSSVMSSAVPCHAPCLSASAVITPLSGSAPSLKRPSSFGKSPRKLQLQQQASGASTASASSQRSLRKPASAYAMNVSSITSAVDRSGGSSGAGKSNPPLHPSDNMRRQVLLSATAARKLVYPLPAAQNPFPFPEEAATMPGPLRSPPQHLPHANVISEPLSSAHHSDVSGSPMSLSLYQKRMAMSGRSPVAAPAEADASIQVPLLTLQLSEVDELSGTPLVPPTRSVEGASNANIAYVMLMGVFVCFGS